MNKLLLIDGNSIANRAFYALPFLSNHEGKPSGAVYGFANILIKILQEEKPSKVIVAFDHARKTFRNEIYSEYKMQRKPAPTELISQFPVIKDMLEAMDIKYIEIAGIEADDIIGTVSKKYTGEKFILSGDRDLLQLIDVNTTVWLTKKGVTEVDKVNEGRLNELFGIKPYQIIELKGLMGDSSDNIPGVKGIGEKTALTLLEKYNDIEGVYAHINEITGKLKEKLIDGRQSAFMSKELATIKRDCEVAFREDELNVKFPFSEKVFEFFNNLDFTSLVKNQKLFLSAGDFKTKNNVERIKIDSTVIESIELKSNVFCYDLKKLEFLIEDKIYYLERNFTLFDNPLSLQTVLDFFKPVFENKDILKITLSAKDDMHFLEKYNIKLINYYDLSLADYLVNAGLKSNIDNTEVSNFISLKERENSLIKEKGLEYIYNKIEFPLINLLYKMEKNGFKINETKLNELAEEYEDKLKKLIAEIYIEANEEFNINSPKQVARILFDKLGIKTYNNKKQSTSAEILEEIRYIPIVEHILTYRKYSKLLNTYINVYRQLCQSNGNIIHTTFNQTLTSTGRLSSSEPNLQNIPTRDDEGKVLRKIFVSKFENGKIISADYNQIELRLLADMSGEENLIDAYNRGDDIHALTASHIFYKPINEITENERRDAKAVNFGIIYGISDYGLSQNIKSTRATAKEFIDSYFTKYPKIKKFMDNNIKSAYEKSGAYTKFGRVRRIPELESSKYLTRTFGERVAMNMPLQGTASDIIKLAMLKVDNRIQQEKLKSQLILQIHDELIIDTYPGEEEKVENILKEEMEHTANLKVPLLISIGTGKNLYDCK